MDHVQFTPFDSWVYDMVLICLSRSINIFKNTMNAIHTYIDLNRHFYDERDFNSFFNFLHE